MRTQEQASLGGMRECWDHAFPPLASPGQLPYWLLLAHTGPIFGQPVGGDHFGSIGTTLLCLAGVIVLWRGKHRWFSYLLRCSRSIWQRLPLRRFPYGGHMRMAMHLMPLVCLLAGFAQPRSCGGWRRAVPPLPNVRRLLNTIGPSHFGRQASPPSG